MDVRTAQSEKLCSTHCCASRKNNNEFLQNYIEPETLEQIFQPRAEKMLLFKVIMLVVSF